MGLILEGSVEVAWKFGVTTKYTNDTKKERWEGGGLAMDLCMLDLGDAKDIKDQKDIQGPKG
jgi:hypothetical protein